MLLRVSPMLLAVGFLGLITGSGLAAEAASFELSMLANEATHVVVVDDKGKVLESWRGDLKPGATLPLADFKIRLEHPVEKRFGKPPEGTPDKVTGKRLVLFLRQGGSKYTKRAHAELWGAGHWMGDFGASTAWIEGESAFALSQLFNPGPQLTFRVGTEADLKKQVEAANASARERIEKLRKEPDLATRAAGLAEIVRKQSGFSADAYGEIVKCGKDGLPALRSILSQDLLGYKERIGAYRAMAQIGEPAKPDLMKLMRDQKEFWGDRLIMVGIFNAGELDYLDEYKSLNLAILLAVTEHPTAFANLSGNEKKMMEDLRGFLASFRGVKTFGKERHRVHERFDRILKSEKP